MTAAAGPLPRWIEIGVVPIVNLALAMLVAALIVLAIGENPLDAIRIMASGAFGDLNGIGYTLYYATNFIFTGLAVAVAFHAGLFNIGGEGQAYIGGLGAGIAALALDHSWPIWAMLPLGLAASAAFGAGWAYIPAYLQAKRGSHIVITTIMFNFLAAALMAYLMVHVYRIQGSMEVVSRYFASSAALPQVDELLARFGVTVPDTPLNLAFVWALACCVIVWLYLWHSRGGYELRATGLAPRAAQYAGIRPDRVIIQAMLISGALAGFVGFNEIMGVHRQLLLDFVAGAGFTGIAVALMGRNHPFGIVLASILFGALYQGGAELAFELPDMTRDMIVVMQGLVILFSGALAYMNRPLVERVWRFYLARRRIPDGAASEDAAPPLALAAAADAAAATPAALEPELPAPFPEIPAPGSLMPAAATAPASGPRTPAFLRPRHRDAVAPASATPAAEAQAAAAPAPPTAPSTGAVTIPIVPRVPAFLRPRGSNATPGAPAAASVASPAAPFQDAEFSPLSREDLPAAAQSADPAPADDSEAGPATEILPARPAKKKRKPRRRVAKATDPGEP